MGDWSLTDPAAYEPAPANAVTRERKWLKDLGPFVPIAALTVDSFGTTPNLIAIIQASAITSIAAVGTAAITIPGRSVSLSIEQQAVTSAYVFAALYTAGHRFWWPRSPHSWSLLCSALSRAIWCRAG